MSEDPAVQLKVTLPDGTCASFSEAADVNDWQSMIAAVRRIQKESNNKLTELLELEKKSGQPTAAGDNTSELDDEVDSDSPADTEPDNKKTKVLDAGV